MSTALREQFIREFVATLPEADRGDPARVFAHAKRASGILQSMTDLARSAGPLAVAGLIAAPPLLGAGAGIAAAKLRGQFDPVIPPFEDDQPVKDQQIEELISRYRILEDQANTAARGRDAQKQLTEATHRRIR